MWYALLVRWHLYIDSALWFISQALGQSFDEQGIKSNNYEEYALSFASLVSL